MSIPKDRRYGSWVGNPQGVSEDTLRCAEEVWPRDGRWTPAQCFRKRGHGPKGELCKQHATRYLVLCEVCDQPCGERFGCSQCGRLFGACCNSMRDGFCIECSDGGSDE